MMIPYALLGGSLYFEDGSEEKIRVLDLSPDSFTFRLVKNDRRKVKRVRLAFLDYRESRYHDIFPENFEIHLTDENEWSAEYEVITEDENFACAAKHLMDDYASYIRFRLEASEPEEGETSGCFAAQKEKWLSGLSPDSLWEETVRKADHIALTADTPWRCRMFLSMDWEDYQNAFRKNFNLNGLTADTLYIGSSYCYLLMPEPSCLRACLEKCRISAITPVIVLPPAAESYLAGMTRLLKVLNDWCTENGETLELVMGDLTPLLIAGKAGYKSFRFSAGVLMAKRRKDVRMKEKYGSTGWGLDMGETAFHADFYDAFLKELGITACEKECSGDALKPFPMESHLHLPFYQMNTSGFCTLYNACHNGARGDGSRTEHCPGYCREHVFLYPDDLHMAGIGGTLFGFDRQSLTDGRYLELMTEGCTRLVFEWL